MCGLSEERAGSGSQWPQGRVGSPPCAGVKQLSRVSLMPARVVEARPGQVPSEARAAPCFSRQRIVCCKWLREKNTS